MFIGQIAKQEGRFWSADIDAIGAHTQGTSRRDAMWMLGDAVEQMVNRDGFQATVTELAASGRKAFSVLVSGSQPAMLAMLVLRYQREVHRLTLAEVARKLGASSVNAYAAYEQGKREPTLSKYLELLAAVAPEMTLTVGPRSTKSATGRPTRRS